MIQPLRRILNLAAMLPLLSACNPFESKGNSVLLGQLERAEGLWRAHGMPSYSYVLVRHCNCSVPPPEVRVFVDNNVVVGAHNVTADEPVATAQLSQFRPLPGYFDLVRDALQRRLPQFSVAYAVQYGFVERLVINYDITTADDDVFFDIESFTPGT